jgi:hypothetical protein
LTGWQRAAQGWYPSHVDTSTYYYPTHYTQMAPQDEAGMIRSRIELLEENIKAARERLAEMENSQD